MKDMFQKHRSLRKSESGAVEMVEAVIIYPFVFLALGVIIYLGIYMIQYATVQTYAEKIALYGAREIASPGYLEMITSANRQAVLGSAAVEADMDVTEEDGLAVIDSGTMKINFDPGNVDVRPYRYWSFDTKNEEASGPFSKSSMTILNGLLKNMVSNNSILCSNDVETNIECENYFLVQFVNVTVSQKIKGMEMLSFFGIDTPKVEVSCKCPVNDVDEFVRNTDFAFDTIEALAEKLGIDVDKLKDKIEDVKKTLHLN